MIAFLGRGVVVLSFSTVFLGVLGLACGLVTIVLVPVLLLALVGWFAGLATKHRMNRELKKLMREGGDVK